MPRPSPRFQTAVRNIHLWVGITAGILFCLMSLSGSVLVFRSALENSLRPHWAPVSTARPRLVLTEAAHNIRLRWPDAKIVALNLSADTGDPYQFDIRTPDGRRLRVFTDSRSGEVLGTFDLPWLTWIVDLHHNLHFGPAGKQAVGLIGIGLFCKSLTGLILWTIRKPDWRKILRIRGNGSWKQIGFDLHRSACLLSNGLLLIVSLTGICLAYPDTLQRAIGAPPARVRQKAKSAQESGRSSESESLPIEDLVAAAGRAVPGGTVRQVRFAGGNGGQAAIRLWAPGDLRPEGSNRVTLDASTARVLQVELAATWSSIRRATQWVTPIHYAEWGGPSLRILWAFIGFVPPTLFASCLIIWLPPCLARRRATRRVGANALVPAEEPVK